MASHCRHIMPGGGRCRGYSLQGGDLCYFHNRQRIAAMKPARFDDSIEIPLLEDRCAIQVTITNVLRAVINKSIDRARASTLLYGLQLSLQSVDRSSLAIPIGTVEAISQTSDGEELADDPDDYEDEDDDENEEDEEEENSDSDETSGDSDDEGDDSEEADDEEDNEEGNDDGLDDETILGLAAEAKFLRSVREAVEANDISLAARLITEATPGENAKASG
jgi:hypothetical protein